MQAKYRSGLAAALALGVAATLAGCSDYPSDGVIDTKLLRSKAEIIEVEGNVYGIKPGGLETYAAWTHDKSALNGALTNVVNARDAGESLPAIELKFSSDKTGFDIDDFQAAVEASLVKYNAAVDARQAELVAEIKTKRDELAAKLEEVSAAGAKHDSYVADAKAKVETAEQSLNQAIDAYNAAFTQPLEEINKLAAAAGLKKLAANSSPINSYRTLDLTNKPVPATCPDQRSYIAVDMLKEAKTCGYIRVANYYRSIYGDIPAIVKPSLLALPALKETLGKKGSWGRSGTGAYGELDQAEKALKERIAEANNKFGNASQQSRQQVWLSNQIDNADSEIVRRESDDYRSTAKGGINAKLDDETAAAAERYLVGLHGHLLSHIEKGPEVVLDDQMAKFSGLDSGYEAAVIVAEFIAEAGGRRDAAASVHFVDLTDEAVKDAGEIRVDLSEDSFSSGRFVDIRDEDALTKATLKVMRNYIRDQDRAKNDA